MYILISLPNKFITENLRTMIDKKNPPRLLRVVHSGLPSIAGLLPDGVGVPATTYDYLRPSQFAYTSLIL